MFVRAQEQLALTAVGNDAGTWSRSSFSGTSGKASMGLAYRANTAVSAVISKRFAHLGSPSTQCPAGIARLGNPEDRP